GEREFRVDDLDVGERIDLACDVDDVVVLEAAHDLHDGVGLADVAEELVAEAFAPGGAGDETGDVHELDGGRQGLLRLDDAGEHVEARVRHGHHADVRVDRAERIVLRGDFRLGERVEERRLADVGKADYS